MGQREGSSTPAPQGRTLLSRPYDHQSPESDSGYGLSHAGSTPLQSKFQEKIRPMLDVVDKLRNLGLMEEGIALPTIVVVGDQSSGKSSVLESLAGITLPRGQGMATRVPLVLRLQASEQKSVTIEYSGVKEEFEKEDDIEKAVVRAQNHLAGDGKGICDSPISLHVRKPDAPDLTMVDLPGITRVPVDGQPVNIDEQISDIIRHYITPPESVILNVLCASVDFPTCQSIRMSQVADKAGTRTLAAVTKVDKSPEGLLEKVTTDAVNIGLGYICVRNRIAESESHDEARAIEKSLFDTHPLLSKLDKSICGIPVLADRLTQIQADSIRRLLPDIISQIERGLQSKRQELASLPQGINSNAEAYIAFSKTMAARTETLKQIVERGDNTQSCFAEDKKMHYTARLDDMFSAFAEYMQESGAGLMDPSNTAKIMEMIGESKGAGLPNFLPSPVFQKLVKGQVDKIALACDTLVQDTHSYADSVQNEVIGHHTAGYATLKAATEVAARTVISESRSNCEKFVERVLAKEGAVIFTKTSLYMKLVNNMKSVKDQEGAGYMDMQAERNRDGLLKFLEDEIGRFDLGELEGRRTSTDFQTAWDMKVSLAAYWAVVSRRITDMLCQEIKYSLQQAMVGEVMDRLLLQTSAGSFQFHTLMDEDSVLAQRRRKLRHSVEILKQAKSAVSETLGKASS